MTLEVIGTGFGRTATMSLRRALDMLGAGPCYHMESVLNQMDTRVDHWNDAITGKPDWENTYDGFHAAVDWPTAAYWRDLQAAYPQARFIHSTRSAESWYKSFSQTILAVLTAPETWPEPQQAWLDMVHQVVIDRTFDGKTDRDSLIAAFEAQEAAVKAAIPADRLLIYRIGDGWEPLCAFLDKPVPAEPYPRSNSRAEFFELMAQGS